MVPLLIGGATTSPAHTSVKIAPQYRSPVVYVKDASRAVGVCQTLTPAGAARARSSPRSARSTSAAASSTPARRSRRRRSRSRRRAPTAARIDWAAYAPVAPRVPGVQRFDDYPLSELLGYIDWMPFFNAWEFAGKFPDILTDPVVGRGGQQPVRRRAPHAEAADRGDAGCRRGRWSGLFPANAVGDDVEIYTDETRTQRADDAELPAPAEGQAGGAAARVPGGLRRAARQRRGRLHRRLRRHRRHRHRGARGALRARARRLLEPSCSRRSPTAWRRRPRSTSTSACGASCGATPRHETLTNEQLIREEYHGIRPAPGYPACPDHTEKAKLWQLLDAERNAGIRLTDSFAMYPTAAVSGWYFAHPQSRYFALGKIDRDQVRGLRAPQGLDARGGAALAVAQPRVRRLGRGTASLSAASDARSRRRAGTRPRPGRASARGSSRVAAAAQREGRSAW